MRVLMIGAGSVGVVLTRFLENKTNEITYYVRAGRRAGLTRVKLVNAKSGEITVRERPPAVEPGQPLPPVDTAILAVRGGQLDEALEVCAQLGPALRIATASAGLDDLARIRQRFPGRPAVQIYPMFLAFPDGDVVKWWNPPLARTLVTWEGDAAAQPFAEELAGELTRGGLPARAISFGSATRDALVAAGMPLLASFELAGWSFAALGGNAELRALAARGMKEGMRAVKSPVARLLNLAPRPLLDTLLRAAPRLPNDMQAMWRVHGPKIAGQTRHLLDHLIARAPESEAPTLRELRRRLD